MKDVATVRVHDMGCAIPEGTRAVERTTAKATDVKFSASGTRAHALMTKLYGNDVADAVAQEGVTWATNRNSNRVWDIDLGAASGFDWTPEGATAFRASINLSDVKDAGTPWPSSPKTTPRKDTPRGAVIDLATGIVRSKGATA